MGNQSQPFSWFDLNIHGLVSTQTGIWRHHWQHGPMVGGGDSEQWIKIWIIKSISQYSMGLSENLSWTNIQPGRQGSVPAWYIWK